MKWPFTLVLVINAGLACLALYFQTLNPAIVWAAFGASSLFMFSIARNRWFRSSIVRFVGLLILVANLLIAVYFVWFSIALDVAE